MKKVIFVLLMCVCMVSLARADLVITNGDFETGAGVNQSIADVNGWYDHSTANFWEDAWQTNAPGVTPNGSDVVVFCSWDSVAGEPLAGSYLYQSIGTSGGESSITIAFDWGHPDDVAAGRLDGITVSVLASDGSFVPDDANDVLGAAGVTVLDYASYDHVAEGTNGEIWPVVVTLDLSGAKAGDEIFLRFNNYNPGGGDPWPVLDNVQITSVESPLVIGDFEGDLDGWYSWYDANNTLAIGTTGVTSGDNSLDVTVNGGYFQIGWSVPPGYVLDLSNVTTLQLDVSMKVADFPPNTWTKVDAIAINSELGWRQIGPTSVVDNDTGEEVPSMDWGTWEGATDSNRTITWDIAAQGYDWTGFEESSYQEIAISAMGNGVFHIDNIRLYGARLLPKVVWVSEMADVDGDQIADDQGWIDLLMDNGYYVSVPPAKEDPNAVYNPYWMVLDANKVDELNSAALVVFSRNTNSGNYDDANEPTMWNSVSTPTILLNAYLARSSRWKWINSGGVLDNIGAPLMEVIDPNQPIFKGVTYLSENVIDFLDPNVDSGRTTFINTTDVGNGLLIAQTLLGTEAYIAKWETGVEFYDGAGQIAGGRRMLFTAGIHSNTSGFGGNLNLTPEGIKVFLNAVDYMVKPVQTAAIDVNNFSFENDGEQDPGAPSGWTWNGEGSLGESAGGESNTEGGLYLWQGNGSVVYQTTDEVIAQQGATYVLQVDVKNSWLADPKIVLYYDDGGTRVELGSTTLPSNGNSWPEPVTMKVTATATAESVGKKIGIELTVDNYPGNFWAHYDNVRLGRVE